MRHFRELLMRVIGVDPGTGITGYGVVDGSAAGQLTYVTCGAIVTPSHTTLSRRLKKIYDELITVFQAYRPSAVVIEETFLSKNFQAALKLGQARGVALLAAEMCEVPVFEYTPAEVKQAVVGYGAAKKEQVQQMVVRLLSTLNPQPSTDSLSHHAADALACAICHLHSLKVKMALGEVGSRK